MDGPETRQKDRMVRPTAVGTARVVVAAIPIWHTLGVSRLAA
jgi:hypothetical protein